MNSKLYIGICANGHGAGKTTFADYAVKFYNTTVRPSVRAEKFSFGTAVKDMLKAVTDISDKNTVPDCFCGKSVRELLQTLGTAWGRKTVGYDLWVNLLNQKISKSDCDVVVIDDVRFCNEFKFVKDHGGVMIYIQRDCAVNDDVESEGLIAPRECDIIMFNNCTLEQLEMNAYSFVQRHMAENAPAAV